MGSGKTLVVTESSVRDLFEKDLSEYSTVMIGGDALRVFSDELRATADFTAHLESLASERAKELLHTDRLANIGMMFSGLAHELKNPLTFISGNAQTLERFFAYLDSIQTVESERVAFIREELPGLFTGIASGVDRMVKLIDTFKMFSSKHVDVAHGFSLKSAVDASVLMCGKRIKEHGITFTALVDDSIKKVCGDQHQIEQVLMNLLVNATDAVETAQHPQITLSCVPTESGVAVSVEDNGSGVPEHVVGEMWKPFVTTKSVGKGTGLGLSICRYIVELHGGTISYYRNAMGGAGFVFWLPYHEESAGGICERE